MRPVPGDLITMRNVTYVTAAVSSFSVGVVVHCLVDQGDCDPNDPRRWETVLVDGRVVIAYIDDNDVIRPREAT